MKQLFISFIFLLLTINPVFAWDIDQINSELKNNTTINDPITIDETIKSSQYNLLKGQFDPWSKADIQRQIAFSILEIIDWGQSRAVANSGHWETTYSPTHGYGHVYVYNEENNPFLGERPTLEQVNNYFLICLFGNMSISHILPQKYRKYWQSLSIFLECYTVGGNYSYGVKIQF